MCRCTQERIRVRAGELCVPIAGTEYVRRHAGGGENRAQPQERGGFRHTGQNHPTPDPGTGARLVALGWRVHYRVAREKGVQPDSVRREGEGEIPRERRRQRGRGKQGGKGSKSERERRREGKRDR